MERERIGKTDASGNYAQILKGSHAAEKDAVAVAVEYKHLTLPTIYTL